MIDRTESSDIFDGPDSLVCHHMQNDQTEAQSQTIHRTFYGVTLYRDRLAAVGRNAAVIYDLHDRITDDIFCNFRIVFDKRQQGAVRQFRIAGGNADRQQVGSFDIGDFDASRQRTDAHIFHDDIFQDSAGQDIRENGTQLLRRTGIDAGAVIGRVDRDRRFCLIGRHIRTCGREIADCPCCQGQY